MKRKGFSRVPQMMLMRDSGGSQGSWQLDQVLWLPGVWLELPLHLLGSRSLTGQMDNGLCGPGATCTLYSSSVINYKEHLRN